MESFRVRFVLGLIALSLGHVSIAVDTDSTFFRQYTDSVDNYADFNGSEAAQYGTKLKSDEWTVFLIHGIKETVDSDSVKTMAKAYLDLKTFNVIAVDYRKIADSKNHIVDAIQVNGVAKVIGNALNQMVDNGLNPDKIHIIGYWLGAQVAAYIGSHTSFTIPRITGLNPAGPKFYVGRFLKSGDAQFVDIIHTDSGVFDQLHNSADADFHPNGGLNKPQPGCRNSDNTQEKNCNRARSWMYYAESVNNQNNFIAVKCADVLQFDLGNCNQDDVVPMGIATPPTASGKFYLRTYATSPFGEGKQGIY